MQYKNDGINEAFSESPVNPFAQVDANQRLFKKKKNIVPEVNIT